MSEEAGAAIVTGIIIVLLVACICIFSLSGSRFEQGFRLGYIAGFAESKAGLPSRHSLPTTQRNGGE